MKSCDIAIVGGGIVGLATAWQLAGRFPQARLLILEKESHVAAHQSGHNSGVLHSGIYYRPGSLKALNCRQGKLAMEAFCREHGVSFSICGKVIVAVDESELPQLQTIFERGRANGVACELISAERLHELEPYAAGIAAIHVPEAGIVDYRQVCEKLAELLRSSGHEIQLDTEVRGIHQESSDVVVITSRDEIRARTLITCGGLWEDRLIKLSGEQPKAQVVPFRGEFYQLKPEAEHLCRALIYPVPDPRFPFLGVHFTRMIDGSVECGPNAVLALARNGYRKGDVNLRDLLGTLGYPGFRKMAAKHWRMGLDEMWRSWNKTAFVTALQRLVPAIRSEHLVAAPAGVRAQALGKDGALVDDFVIQRSGRLIHVGNAPSPAATASLNIGSLIADQVSEANIEFVN
ncbi:L-2-hydroxyglutarate oxidase [Planctomicrobium sp. SH661]|uniref:L-2-hydroxyglutarate oxidase n=1 Tax=Planctomicrobium sp. SH661 TaxID=3448124 RepID=UPI003F5C4DC8